MNLLNAKPTSGICTVARILLGGILAFAGISHLTFARDEFQAKVPDWVPGDDVVLASGLVEITLGAALIGFARGRVSVGLLTAAFFVAIFPGNIAQYLDAKDAFGLDTDQKRLVRLFFQPVLVLWAVWSTAAWRDRPIRPR